MSDSHRELISDTVTGYDGYMESQVTDIDVPAGELRFHRESGRVCLDLVATIGERWRRRFERLRDPADLDRWLDAVGLAIHEPAAPTDLQATRGLRAAIEQVAVAAMQDQAYPSGAIDIVNGAASSPGPVPQLRGGSSLITIRSHTAARSAIARDAVDLFGGPGARRVRECDAADCALVFVDTSRPGTRRWCSMSACGNRRKVARHRRSQANT